MRTVFIAVVCQFLCDFVAGKRFDAFGVVLAAGDDEFVSILAGFDQVVDGLPMNLRSTAAPAPAALTRACGPHLNADKPCAYSNTPSTSVRASCWTWRRWSSSRSDSA